MTTLNTVNDSAAHREPAEPLPDPFANAGSSFELTIEFEDEDDAPAQSGLIGLTRNILGQYVDILAHFARDAMAGRTTTGSEAPARAALGALSRLADATDDAPLQENLRSLEELLDSPVAGGRRNRALYLRSMRDWVLGFSALLQEDEAARMTALVRYEGDESPLLNELLDVYGVGPRRLERLYCSGLFTIEALLEAEASEVADVTGMNLKLARRVLYHVRRYERDTRLATARALRDSVTDAVRLTRDVLRAGRTAPGVIWAIEDCQQALADLLAELGRGHSTPQPTETTSTFEEDA